MTFLGSVPCGHAYDIMEARPWSSGRKDYGDDAFD